MPCSLTQLLRYKQIQKEPLTIVLPNINNKNKTSSDMCVGQDHQLILVKKFDHEHNSNQI